MIIITMQNFTIQKYFYYIAFMVMASTYLPLVFNNLPPIVRSHHLWTIIWGISILLSQPKIIFRKPMLYILLYGLLILLTLLLIFTKMDKWNSRMLIGEFYNIVVGASIISYFLTNRDYIGLAKLTKWSLVFLFITAIMSIISSAIDPLYARNILNLASEKSSSNVESVLRYKQYGGGGYSTATVFMCLFPLIIYYYKNIRLSLISKKLIIVVCITLFFALVGMQIFANLLMAVAFGGLALFGMKKIVRSVIIIALISFILLVIPTKVYVDTIASVGEIFSVGSENSYKFKDLAEFIEIGAGSAENTTGAGYRSSRYTQLSETFFQAPILGCFFYPNDNTYGYFNYYFDYGDDRGQVEGTHLHWMNKMTITGIIGLLLFLYIPYSFIKNTSRNFDSEYKFYYIIAALSILCLGLIKTLAGRETWYAFFVILPGMYYLPLLKKQKNNIQ